MKKYFHQILAKKNQPNFSFKYWKIILIGFCLSFTNCHKKANENPKPQNLKPIASFAFKIPANGALPCVVNFSDSSKYADTYKWDFGDGNISTSQNPNNTYTVAKTYTVKLVVSNSYGKDSITQAVTVTLNKPRANFRFTIVNNGTLPCQVNFKDSSLYASTYKWDFGDGVSSTDQNPHETYTLAKTYNVKLTVSNASGTDSITQKVTIILNKPKAGFDFTIVDNGNLPTTVNFTNTSTGAASYKWIFDDGKQSTDINPTEKYSSSKTYNVKLVVSNAAGKDSVTKAVAITINKPKADFDFNVLNAGAMPCNVAFVNNSARGQTYTWYFGDGSTSTVQSPQKVYSQSKIFTVKLVVTSVAGKDSITKQVTISPINYSVRIYLITPTDRQFNQKYFNVLKTTALNLQAWYKQQMNGKTFTLNNPVVDTLRGKHSYAWYNQYNDTYSGTDPRFYGYYNTLYEIQQVIGNLNTSLYMNAIYVAAPGGGAGSPGICALGDQDLDGLLGINPSDKNINRWIGGSGHEWGHGFALNHPANQDPNALMWTGYITYPNCVLLQEDKDILNNSKFFK